MAADGHLPDVRILIQLPALDRATQQSKWATTLRQQARWIDIPSIARDIYDVSGAGDTVVAVASLVYAATKDVRLMAEVANIAGGLVCEEVGTVAIDKTRLLEECKRLLR